MIHISFPIRLVGDRIVPYFQISIGPSARYEERRIYTSRAQRRVVIEKHDLQKASQFPYWAAV